MTDKLRAFFNRFPDTEGEQATIRALFCPLVAGLYMYSLPDHDGPWLLDHRLLYTMVVLYGIAAMLILLALLRNPVASKGRRIAALTVDATTVTASMLATYQYGIAFFGFYMWICLGYGLRYGTAFLRLAQIVTVFGFVVVLVLSPYWRAHLQIGLGLLVTMFYLPPLASLILERARRARADAEDANKAKSRFVANISHEIRTPLNAIIGFTDLLATSQLSSEQKQWMRTISSSATLLLSLVNNVLDFARIEAGKVTIAQSQFRLSELLDSVINVLGPQAEAKGLYLTIEETPADVDWLIGDRDHVTQVLINLIANAIKFTDRGGVTVRIAKSAETPTGVELTWQIVDTGVGMPSDALTRIFDSFAQADEKTRRRYGGTGLGTTIAKELVERMGGTIGVQSSSGQGSTFWFRLPFSWTVARTGGDVLTCHTAIDALRAEAVPAAVGTSMQTSDEATDVDRARVLVVEDNAANRKVAAKILELGGYTIQLAESGQSALVDLACENYELVLLDMELPELNGLDLLAHIRQLYGPRIRIVMLTANATPEARESCVAAGADGFLTKPITAITLLSTIQAVLSAAQERPSPTIEDGLLCSDKLKAQLSLAKDMNFLVELVELWRNDTDVAVCDLEQAIHRNDSSLAQKHLHIIEGGAGEVGAHGLLAACQALRSVLRASDRPAWRESAKALHAVYQKTAFALDWLTGVAKRQPVELDV